MQEPYYYNSHRHIYNLKYSIFQSHPLNALTYETLLCVNKKLVTPSL